MGLPHDSLSPSAWSLWPKGDKGTVTFSPNFYTVILVHTWLRCSNHWASQEQQGGTPLRANWAENSLCSLWCPLVWKDTALSFPFLYPATPSGPDVTCISVPQILMTLADLNDVCDRRGVLVLNVISRAWKLLFLVSAPWAVVLGCSTLESHMRHTETQTGEGKHPERFLGQVAPRFIRNLRW